MFQEGIAFLESIYNLSAIFTAVSVTLMGIFVYFKNPKSPVNRSYTLFLASMALWSGALFICQVSPGKETSLLWNRILHIGVAIIPVAFLRYVLIYLGELKKKYKIMIFYYIFMAAIIIVDLFTPLIIQDMEPKWYFRLWPVPGSLYPALMGLFFSGFSYSILLLVLALGKSSGYKRTQLKYILFAMLIAASGGSMNFFLFYNIRIHPLSNWFCFFYSIIITFAIIRYKLMEIDTVIHRTALWLLSLTLLILPFGIVFMVLKEKIILLNPIWIAGIISITLLIFLTYYNRVKPRIDHFFRRRKYDYQLALAEMPSRIGSSLDLKVLGESLFDQIKELLYVRNGLLLIRPVDKDSFEEFYSFGYPELDQGKKEKKEVSLLKKDPLLTWMETHLGTLELSQVEIDPQYASIQKQALDFFYETSLVLLIPFVMQDKLVSILGLGKKENLQPFQIKDVELFEKIGKQLGITIDNALHHGDIVEKERIEEELKLGREIQTSLLPLEPPKAPRLSLQGSMQPAKEIGGDYYDFINLPDKKNFGIVIGDVSGKGVAAGLLMAMVKTAIHIFSQKEVSPKKTLQHLNRVLNQHIHGEQFMTMLYLIWHAGSSKLVYSSAGHENMLVYRASSNKIERIGSEGIMLGVMPDIEKLIEEKQLELKSKDKVLLYTDGATDARKEDKERFGQKRLIESFERHSKKSPLEIMQAIKEDIRTFIGHYPQYDDITIVVLEAE